MRRRLRTCKPRPHSRRAHSHRPPSGPRLDDTCDCKIKGFCINLKGFNNKFHEKKQKRSQIKGQEKPRPLKLRMEALAGGLAGAGGA